MPLKCYKVELRRQNACVLFNVLISLLSLSFTVHGTLIIRQIHNSCRLWVSVARMPSIVGGAGWGVQVFTCTQNHRTTFECSQNISIFTDWTEFVPVDSIGSHHNNASFASYFLMVSRSSRDFWSFNTGRLRRIKFFVIIARPRDTLTAVRLQTNKLWSITTSTHAQCRQTNPCLISFRSIDRTQCNGRFSLINSVRAILLTLILITDTEMIVHLHLFATIHCLILIYFVFHIIRLPPFDL